MKRALIPALALSCLVTWAWSQNPKTTPEKTPPVQQTPENKSAQQIYYEISGSHYASKYSVAMRWNDLEVAKDALYDLILQYPGNDSLIFSLGYFYYEHQNFPSSILVCKDLLARNPKNEGALELSAVGYENLNIYDRALQNYESLYLLTSNATTLYKMAFLQYQLKKYQESLTNLDILLAKPEANTLKITFDEKDAKPKEYLLKVALLNLKGMVYKDQGDKVNAKKFFTDALAAAPDFKPAKDNLDSLK